MVEAIIRMAMTFRIGSHELSFETYVPQETEAKDMNLVADKLEAVATRQMLKGKVSELKATIDECNKHIDISQTDYNKLILDQERKIAEWELGDKRQKPGINTHDQQSIKNSEESLRTFLDRKKRLEEQLEALEIYLAA
jgi:hypothetical protein